jgi:large subunit ribosomal protein L1
VGVRYKDVNTTGDNNMAKNDLDELIEESEKAIEKGEDLSEIEAEHHHKVKEESKSKQEKIEERIKEKKFDKSEKQDEQISGESDNQEEKKETKSEKTDEKVTKDKKLKPKKPKQGKARVRSKKYQEATKLIDPKKKYDILEALELVEKSSYTKFPGNVELHIRILGKNGKPEALRGMINYPHNIGKTVKVVILDEKIIKKITDTKKTDADLYLATPDLMPQIAKIAKILGPKGKMPSPKAGTVTKDPEKTKKDLENGQTEYKSDNYGIVHQIIGKVNGKPEELQDNYKTLISVLPNDKIVSINMCATMGPGIKIQK